MPGNWVDLIDRPGEPNWGAGEPAACAIPAAVGNAVFDATGARRRASPTAANSAGRAATRPPPQCMGAAVSPTVTRFIRRLCVPSKSLRAWMVQRLSQISVSPTCQTCS